MSGDVPTQRRKGAEAQPDLPHLPIEKWLSPKEVAGHFGLQEDSAYRWHNEGLIRRELVRYCGRWRIRVHPAAIRELEILFEDAHA